MPKTPAHRLRRKPPFFHPVPLRSRRDGWTVPRQCAFLAALYVTGSVAGAARSVGLSRASAYRLRERDGAAGFAFAWDCVLTAPGSGRQTRPKTDWRKVTLDAVLQRAETGMVQPVIHRGTMTGIRRKADNSALLRAVRRIAPVQKKKGADH
ncbi:hypothetical protein [Qipengyuania sp. JC766]|uniref:hypothetical protein n=1 Tax=Qipengyuania sp. JC766 TaxID=3232139 RepID=UPI003458F4DE